MTTIKTCIRCEQHLTFLQRIVRRDGFCSNTCQIKDAEYINQVAVERLQEPVFYDYKPPQPILRYKGLTLLPE